MKVRKNYGLWQHYVGSWYTLFQGGDQLYKIFQGYGSWGSSQLLRQMEQQSQALIGSLVLTMWIQLAGSFVHPVKDLRMWRAHPLLRLVGIPRS